MCTLTLQCRLLMYTVVREPYARENTTSEPHFWGLNPLSQRNLSLWQVSQSLQNEQQTCKHHKKQVFLTKNSKQKAKPTQKTTNTSIKSTFHTFWIFHYFSKFHHFSHQVNFLPTSTLGPLGTLLNNASAIFNFELINLKYVSVNCKVVFKRFLSSTQACTA